MNASQKWEMIRAYRNQLLRECDYAMLPDAPQVTTEQRDALAAYRLTLARIELDYQSPNDVVFPDAPTIERGGIPQAEIEYSSPVVAPVMKAGQYVEAPEYFVLSPKPQDTPEAALSKAVEIAARSKKGLAEIVLNLVKVVEAQDKEIKLLKEKSK